MGYFSYWRSTIPSTVRATLPIPLGKGIIQTLGEGRAVQSPSPVSLPGSRADPFPWLEQGRLTWWHLRWLQSCILSPCSKEMPPENVPSQRRICSAPKQNGFPQPSCWEARGAGKRFDLPRRRPPAPETLPAAGYEDQLPRPMGSCGAG